MEQRQRPIEPTPHTPMKPRMIPRLQGSYKAAEFLGNLSGVEPIGKKVLVETDEFLPITEGGVHIPLDLLESRNMASESGVIVECGKDAFSRHADGSRWEGKKPVPGMHVYFEKYAGVLVMGNDGKRYRLMDDGCIGATYSVWGAGDLVGDK